MPAWSLYLLFLLGALAGILAAPRDRGVRLVGFSCMAAVFVAVALSQTTELGDDIESYQAWAAAVSRSRSWQDISDLHSDVGFSALLWLIVQVTGSTDLASIILPILGALIAGVATYSMTANWPLAMTLLLSNRMFLDSAFNYIRSTLSSAIALTGVATARGHPISWSLLLFIPAFLVHQKAAVLVAVLAVAARLLSPRPALWLLAASSLFLAARTQVEVQVLPSAIAQIDVFREASRYEQYAGAVPLVPMSLAAQVIIYVAVPLLAAATSRTELTARGNYFLSLGVVCLAVYSFLGPELPLLVRAMPVALIISMGLAASVFDKRMFVVRCTLIAANLVGLANIISRGEIVTY